jgi:hypothetical protein
MSLEPELPPPSVRENRWDAGKIELRAKTPLIYVNHVLSPRRVHCVTSVTQVNLPYSAAIL